MAQETQAKCKTNEDYAALIGELTGADSSGVDGILEKRLEDAIGDGWHWRHILIVLPLILGEVLKEVAGDDESKWATGRTKINEVLKSAFDGAKRETRRTDLKAFIDQWSREDVNTDR